MSTWTLRPIRRRSIVFLPPTPPPWNWPQPGRIRPVRRFARSDPRRPVGCGFEHRLAICRSAPAACRSTAASFDLPPGTAFALSRQVPATCSNARKRTAWRSGTSRETAPAEETWGDLAGRALLNSALGSAGRASRDRTLAGNFSFAGSHTHDQYALLARTAGNAGRKQRGRNARVLGGAASGPHRRVHGRAHGRRVLGDSAACRSGDSRSDFRLFQSRQAGRNHRVGRPGRDRPADRRAAGRRSRRHSQGGAGRRSSTSCCRSCRRSTAATSCACVRIPRERPGR